MVKSTNPPQLAAARQRGRPARLSHAAIVAKTVELLEQHAPADVTLNAVAKAVDAPVMSIYKYFPNREALLMAAAAQVFSLLEMPEPQPSWQETLLVGLWALQHHCERHPVAFKVMDVNNEATSAMLGVNAHFLQQLRGLGLRGADLAFAHSWFLNSAIGLIATQVTNPAARHSIPLHLLEALPAASQDVLLELRQHLPAVDTEKLLDFGFRQLIRCLEQLLPAGS